MGYTPLAIICVGDCLVTFSVTAGETLSAIGIFWYFFVLGSHSPTTDFFWVADSFILQFHGAFFLFVNTMSSFEQLKAQPVKLGHTGSNISDYVTKQQAIEREEQAIEREKQAIEREEQATEHEERRMKKANSS